MHSGPSHKGGLQDGAPGLDGHTPQLAEAIVSTLREPLLVLNAAFEVLVANQAFYQAFQVRPGETVGRSLFALDGGRWDIDALRHLLEEVLSRHAHFGDFEVTLDLAHRGRRVMLLNARQLAPVEGLPAMILLAFEDLTERVAWQEQEARLNERVAARTEALERANRALEASNRELEDFAYIASHDLQEPLRKIRAFADVMTEDCADLLDDSGRHYLERIRDGAARMASLIDGLLAFARVAADREATEPTDLNAVVAAVLNDLDLPITEAGARVEVGELPTIEANPMQMRQLFQNLLGNALKYQPAGRVPHVRLQAEHLADAEPVRWCLRVEDNGIGIPEKDLERIFRPFQRLHRREQYAGTGIGLAICRRIVERLDGTIRAESRPGEGTAFVIELPARRSGEVAQV